MSLNLKILGEGTLTTSSATLATAGNGVRTIVRELVIANSSTVSALNATITFNTKKIVPWESIGVNDSLVVDLHSVLTSGYLIAGFGSSATNLDYFISGLEMST